MIRNMLSTKLSNKFSIWQLGHQHVYVHVSFCVTYSSINYKLADVYRYRSVKFPFMCPLASTHLSVSLESPGLDKSPAMASCKAVARLAARRASSRAAAASAAAAAAALSAVALARAASLSLPFKAEFSSFSSL